MTFAHVSYLWTLFLLLPLAALFYRSQKSRKQLLSKIVATRLYPALVGRVSMPKRITRIALILLALASLIVALAQPRFGYEERQVPSHGRDVIIAIDTSRSMLSIDVTPTRLARAKLLAQDALELLPGDRVGLIAFAGEAFLQAPMTLDHSAVRDAINELDTNIIPKGGTNISSAILLAITAFGKGEGTDRALILMTDGEDLAADAVAAAKEAASQGIKIFTIGIGSAEGSLIPIVNEQGGNDFVRDERGKPVLSKLDVSRLQEIAAAANGFYEPFGNDAARTIIQKGILPLGASDSKVITTRHPIERYEWPLGAALLFLIGYLLISERRRGKLPSHSLGIFFIGLLLLPKTGTAAPTGLGDYTEGNYGAALNAFEERLKAGNVADEVRFDAGAAAYEQGDYKKAVGYFTEAMTSKSPKIQQAATYNLANALVREGEATTESAEKLSTWNNAIQHYDTVLKADPLNKNAQENRAIVKKLIEELKKQEEQQKKNPKQEKNPSQQNQQQKDQQQQQNQQNNSSKDQQQKDQQQQSGGQGSSQDKSNSSEQPKDSQNQNNSADQQKQNSSTPPPSSGSNKGSGGNSAPPQTPTSSPNSPQQGAQTNQPSNQSGSPAPTEEQKNSQPMNASQAASGEKSGAEEKKSGALSGGEQTEAAANAAAAEAGTNGMMSRSQAEAVLRSVQDEEQQVQFQHRKESDETTKDW